MAQGLTLDAFYSLQRAYFEGVETVQYADKRVTYRSRADMRRILEEAAAELGVVAFPRMNQARAQTNKGLD